MPFEESSEIVANVVERGRVEKDSLKSYLPIYCWICPSIPRQIKYILIDGVPQREGNV